ncbi:MAG: ribosome assembly factor SBDS [Nanobdellota archaeon]
MKGDKLIDDRVQISINVVKYKSHGRQFEAVIDPDKAVSYKEGSLLSTDEIFKADNVFSDARKGLFAGDDDLMTVFGTTNQDSIKKTLLEKGEIQFTQKYRDDLRKRRERHVLHELHRNTVDPKTGLPHPQTRLKAALDEAKVRIDPLQRAHDQIKDIVRKLSPIIPISYERLVLEVVVPPSYAPRVQGKIREFGTIRREEWASDGSLIAAIELPAGLKQDCIDSLNSLSKGSCTIKKSQRFKT